MWVENIKHERYGDRIFQLDSAKKHLLSDSVKKATLIIPENDFYTLVRPDLGEISIFSPTGLNTTILVEDIQYGLNIYFYDDKKLDEYDCYLLGEYEDQLIQRSNKRLTSWIEEQVTNVKKIRQSGLIDIGHVHRKYIGRPNDLATDEPLLEEEIQNIKPVLVDIVSAIDLPPPFRKGEYYAGLVERL